MRRLYYIVDDLDTASRISEQLHDEGITDWNFHVLAKDDQGLYRHNLHSALPLHRHDSVRLGERCGLIGAAGGLITGLGLYGLQIAPWFDRFWVVLLALLGGLVGTLYGCIAGSKRDNYKIAAFHDDIEAGRLLIMVDVRPANKALVRQIMNLSFSEAEYKGNDSTIISPFKPAHRILPQRLHYP